jgi:hypothetical protein
VASTPEPTAIVAPTPSHTYQCAFCGAVATMWVLMIGDRMVEHACATCAQLPAMRLLDLLHSRSFVA